jgi:hypothetical protein
MCDKRSTLNLFRRRRRPCSPKHVQHPRAYHNNHHDQPQFRSFSTDQPVPLRVGALDQQTASFALFACATHQPWRRQRSARTNSSMLVSRGGKFWRFGICGVCRVTDVSEYRKTGITLEDKGVRDEYGMEPVSGIFSSPAKPSPKHGSNSRSRETLTTSESMDIQESEFVYKTAWTRHTSMVWG